MRIKSLRLNALLNVLRTVLNIIFPLITFPYISHVLQVEAVGAYNFSASIISYFILLAGLGVSTYAIREGAYYRDEKEKIQGFISEVFSINLISTALSYILLFLVVTNFKTVNRYSQIIYILSLEILFTTLSVSWICNIFEDFFFITIQSIGVQFVSFLLTILFVKKTSDLIVYIFIIVMTRALSAIINYIYIQKKYCKFCFTFKTNWKKHLKPILIIFSTSLAITIYVSSDTTMLGFMTNDYQVGLYSTAVKIYTIVKNIFAALLVVLIPRFSILLNSKEIPQVELNKVFSKVVNTLMFMAFPAIIGLFMVSKDVIHVIGGVRYLGGTESLQLLCVAMFFSLLAILYTQCILFPVKEESFVFITTLISAIINIMLNFFMIPMLGIIGASITTILAEMIVCIASYFQSKKYVSFIGKKSEFIKIIIGCIGIVLVRIIFLYIFDNYLLRLFLTVIFGGFTYLVIEYICNNSLLIEYMYKLKNIIKK